jgi:hypothetical protein
MKGSKEALDTGRLHLRPFEPGDAEQLPGILGDAETMVYYDAAFTPDQLDAWVQRPMGWRHFIDVLEPWHVGNSSDRA